ncbi:cupin domain-containing protein [Phenylobacterium sp.]|uniref:cupin domain-containing protein n=1 Tax=Phenylobacterium sp. TaxID=1871053 RepID=UPI002ED854AB
MNEMLADQVAHTDRVAGFVDVLRTSEQWPPVEEESGVDGYFPDRRRLPLPEGPITLEIAQVQRGDSGRTRLPGDQFVLVLEGDITLEQSGVQCALTAGEAGVVVRERPLDWRSDRGGKLVLMRYTGGGGAGADGPVRIDQGAPLAPSNPPAPDVLIGPTPACRNHTDYRSGSGELVCGTWDSTPYKRRLITFRHYELMRLLEGSVTFVDAAGREGTFGAGDVVLFEQGGGASWESREYVKKIYCTYRPA